MNTPIAWNKQALLELPAFEPLHPAIALLESAGFPSLEECNALLEARSPRIVAGSGKLLRFVPQEYGKLPFEAQYEPRCYLKGEVPTRKDNWHDLLNALVWLTFPKAKAAINLRHYQAQSGGEGEETGNRRGTVRDTNTLLDESGVIVACADAGLASLLRDFQWKELFWHRRAEVLRKMGFFLFGHGLYEKALNPYVGMTGQGLILQVPQEFCGWPLARRLEHLDGLLADYLADAGHCRSTKELTPVPLLGIPGWTAENELPSYYDNTDYFRPGRQSRAQRTPLNTAPSSVAG